ncbi:30S ribosomal protein S4 [Candidatus Peregrinibacteria bacterium CG08_land_8_20_14_0_20_41_10]|nr:MAG: 30S ribosomal protein S4 [Candidatus Peregrinibacteria bacterium CG1_02_41_10]PIS32221.1 MAG: 30S ribosomal protein S4 [Candidatus Peregrinibacteria bacterium CG08_land_8_20_14_0_20_41_10]
MRRLGPKCRLCRMEGEKLFLRGERCESQKCAVLRRGSPPGMHGKKRKKMTEYGRQMRAKQKLKKIYGISEAQLLIYFKKAGRSVGATDQTLLKLLEMRVDNFLYRSGLADSLSQARQWIGHGLFKLNGRSITIPSIQVKGGSTLELKAKHGDKMIFLKKRDLKLSAPVWMETNPKEIKITCLREPELKELETTLDLQLVVEYYSR